MAKTPAPPRSLNQYFIAPEGYQGLFALMCGYSADALFLNDALEKFTGLTEAQRAFDGKASMALMLDPHHPQISPLQCPGLLHLGFNPTAQTSKTPFTLLHAKVVLLVFRHKDSDETRIRLLVSTGNWTSETLDASLDLIWCADASTNDPQTDDLKTIADITAAHDFFNHLLSWFDTRLLNASPLNDSLKDTPSQQLYARFIATLNAVPVTDVKPRFFDNRAQSLLDQLADKILQCSSSTPRNYLAMGSGFFQSGQSTQVIDKIHQTLATATLVTKFAEKALFVNPQNCQSVAQMLQPLKSSGWDVFPATDPLYLDKPVARSLHAKFIFSASYRDNSDKCLNPWVYFGSGNLTNPGFIQKAGNQGNLEAGVVFNPEPIYWDEAKGRAVITERLPIDWDEDKQITESDGKLSAGDDMEHHEDHYFAAPICCVFATISPSKADNDAPNYYLSVPDSASENYQLLDRNDQPCQRRDNGDFIWPDTLPRQVSVQWQDGDNTYTTKVPVIDENGRIAATQLPELDVDSAWSLLNSFPALPYDEELGEGLAGNEAQDGAAPALTGNTGQSHYPVREMMQLVENIAAKQTQIRAIDWPQWCQRLQQTLSQAAGSEVVSHFQQINLNPLYPLWHSASRPEYAESADTSEGQRYNQALEAIELRLGFSTLDKLGSQPS